jgi:hypothetical protein
MTNSQLAQRHESTVAGTTVDWNAVYKTLGLSPQDPRTQALLLVCDRYGLDPLLKHAVLIEGRVYITRDGLLHVAHKSGVFDGIEVVEGPTLDQKSGDWHAKVAVWRRDMQRAIAYPGRYPEKGSNRKYAPEMAIKVAEVMALRRAFNIAVATREEQWDRAADSGDVYPGDDLDRKGADDDHRHLVERIAARADELVDDGAMTPDDRAKAIGYAGKSLAHAEKAWDRLTQRGDPEQPALEEPS